MIGLRYATENNMTLKFTTQIDSLLSEKLRPLRNRHMAEVCDYVIFVFGTEK